MKNLFKIGVSVVFLGLISLPPLQATFKFIPQTPLFNTTIGVKPIKLSFKAWRKGRLASWFEHAFVRQSGLYGLFIKLNNSINYPLRVAAPAYRGDVLIGLNGGLLHSLTIEGLNGAPHVSDASLTKTAAELERLSDTLSAQGTKMVTIFSPNKALLRPELVPSGFYSPRPAPRIIDRFLPKLDKLKSPLINLSADLSKIDLKLYAKSGAHLNSLGACLAAESLSKVINPKPLHCQILAGESAPSFEDLDLARLLNVFSFKNSIEPQPAVSITPCSGKTPQNILFIGTSNLFGIINALRIGGCLGDRDYYFYTKSLYSCRLDKNTNKESCTKRPQRKKGEFSPELLKQRTFVVLEAPAARAHQIGFGKIQALLSEKSK